MSPHLSRPLQKHSILIVLPTLHCLTSAQLLAQLQARVPYIDEKILDSDLIQRPCQYLLAVKNIGLNLVTVRYNRDEHLSSQACLSLLLEHLERLDPTWS